MTSVATVADCIPADALADAEAVVIALRTGHRPQLELARRIDERAERITAEIMHRHGLLDISTPAIRELRDRV